MAAGRPSPNSKRFTNLSKRMIYIGDISNGRDNNFNLLRMIAAGAVLVSHAYPIALGNGAVEPLSSLLQMSLGTLAVLSFFAISGFFISQSFDRRNGLVDFAVARILRVYPGLVVVLFLTVFVFQGQSSPANAGRYTFRSRKHFCIFLETSR